MENRADKFGKDAIWEVLMRLFYLKLIFSRKGNLRKILLSKFSTEVQIVHQDCQNITI